MTYNSEIIGAPTIYLKVNIKFNSKYIAQYIIFMYLSRGTALNPRCIIYV